MRADACIAALALAGLLACDQPTGAPTGGSGLSLIIQASGLALDSGYILVRGPTPKTVKVVPPATVTIDGLLPGPYTVSLEGFANDVVDRFFPPTNVIVAKGQNASVTVTAAQFASFVPSQVTAPSSISGKTFRVSYEAVGGAMRYEAQAASEQSFATIKGTGEATPPQTSVDVTVPDYGTYYVRMRAVDPYQSKGGWATPPGSITLTPPPQADLIVESLTHTPASPTTTDVIRFTAVVKNAGTASAGASTLELRVGGETPGASPTQLAVPVLAPGATYTAERQLQLAAGPYRTTATADVANVVTESDETNNVKTDDYTVTTAPRADLVITTPVTVTPTSVTPGGTVTLSNYTVANQGAAGSNAFRLGYYLSSDATIAQGDRLLVSNNAAALAAGASVTFTGPALTIPADVAPGSYFIGPWVDDLDATPESNEENNFRSTALTVTPAQADLIVESLTHVPASPTTTDVIRFTAVVKNAGTASAGASTLELRVGGETPGASPTQLAVPVLAPGATYTAERQLQLAAGPYRTTATADVANVVTESDETNNVKTDDYTVTTAPRADLVISAPATLTVTPTSVAPGGTVTLSNYTVTNQGTAPSNAYRLGYYLSVDATITTADRLLVANSTTALAAGASVTVTGPTLPIPSDVTPGSYFVGPLVDDQNATVESDETNNFKSTALTVGQPDLVISSWGVPPVTPTSVAPGSTVSLAGLTVFNQGTVASNAYRVGFYLSADTTITANDVFLSGTSAIALGSGSSVTIPPRSLVIPAGIAPGNYFIGPLLDDQNATVESDETNNFRSTALTISGPDLVVSSWGVPPVTPTSVPPQGAVSLSGFTVTNQGTAASNAYRIGFYLSGDTTLAATDLFASSTLATALGAGASITIPPQTFSIPVGATAGRYFIGPLLDDQNGTAESNEANNFRSASLTVLTPDQVNDPTSGTSFSCGGSAGSLYQGFTPTRSSLVAVELRLSVGGSFPAGGTPTTVNVRSGSPAGTILGSSTVFVVGPQPAGRQFLALFQFAPAVVTPGSQLVVEWVATPGTVLNWVGSANNPYAGGTMFGCTGIADPGSDLNFRTY